MTACGHRRTCGDPATTHVRGRCDHGTGTPLPLCDFHAVLLGGLFRAVRGCNPTAASHPFDERTCGDDGSVWLDDRCAVWEGAEL